MERERKKTRGASAWARVVCERFPRSVNPASPNQGTLHDISHDICDPSQKYKKYTIRYNNTPVEVNKKQNILIDRSMNEILFIYFFNNDNKKMFTICLGSFSNKISYLGSFTNISNI